MKKNILLGIILITFSFLFIGNVKGDENNNIFSVEGEKYAAIACDYEVIHEIYHRVRFEATNGGKKIETTLTPGSGYSVSLDEKNQKSIEEWVLKNKKCPKLMLTVDTQTSSGITGKVNSVGYLGAGTKKNPSSTLKKYCGDDKNKCKYYNFAAVSGGKNADDADDNRQGDRTIEDFKKKYVKDSNKPQSNTTAEMVEGCGLVPKEVADEISKVLYLAIVAAFVLTIILGIKDFIGAVTGAKDDGMKKAWKNFIRRIVALALLLLLPLLVKFVLTQIDFDNVDKDSIFCGVKTDY